MLLKAEGHFPGRTRGGGVAGPPGEFAGGEAGHRVLEHWSGFRGLGLNLDSVLLGELTSWFCSLAFALTHEVIVPTFRVIVRVTGGNRC